jgi:ankyrin repeat protein
MAEYSVLCAVATGKADLVAAAVAKGCTVNETDQEGNSCLHIAAAQGSNEILRILLHAGAKLSAKNEGGMTALALACVKVGNMEKLSWGGASADEAPPGLAVGRWVRATVTFTTNSEEAKEVRKGSLGVVAEIDQDGDAWIDFEGLDAKQLVLQSNFGSISVLSQEDVLKERAQREEVVAMLIAPTQAAGALNEANNEGATPLMHASMRGLCGVVELLLAAGADVATKDKNGKGVFDHTKEIKDEEKRVAVLALMAEYSVLCAVATGKADLVAAAVAKGCNMIDTDLAGNTAVELAQNAQTIDVLKGAGATMPEFPEEKKNDLLIEYAEKGATGGALMALQAGADVNHKGEFSRTALHEAAEKGHEALAQCLLGAGADIKAADVTGSTPLHWAAYSNKPEVAKVLLANGAQVNVRNTRGRTALALARLHRNREMEALLLQHGAECSPSGALDFGSLIFTET